MAYQALIKLVVFFSLLRVIHSILDLRAQLLYFQLHHV